MSRVLWLAFLLLAILHLPATAHDMWGLANPTLNDPDLVISQDLASAANQQPSNSRERYLLERTLLWAPGALLRACFTDGASEERSRVTEAVKALQLHNQKVNIDIELTGDCQSGSAEEIRISFISGCCFAYLGRTALHPKLKGLPTVYLRSGLDSFLIQHEILHALGVHHEHQNPQGANCYDRLVDVQGYARSNGWDIDTTKSNVQSFGQDHRRFVWSNERDKESIMHYHIPASFLKGREGDSCYVGVNRKLSEGDYNGLRIAYPEGAQSTTIRRDELPTTANIKNLSPKLSSFLDAISLR
jgi:hypothetical protein